jgi:hypothetical protein
VPLRAVLRIVTGRRPQSGPITRASGVRAPAPGRTSLRARHRRSRSQSVRRHGAALPASFRVAAIRLDSVARLHWDHRRRHYDAAMSTIGQPTVQPVTTRDGFVAEAQTTALPSLAAILRRILGRSQKTRTCRTSPPRPLSATATHAIALCTYNPTWVISCI